MLDPANVPDIDAEEMSARFIFSRSHINRQTGTVKADAFVPHPYEELSVTRLIQITDSEIWELGRDIGIKRIPARTLHGRGDVLVATYLSQDGLEVQADPVEGNPNHALVIGWPVGPADQLLLAKEIAAVTKFIPPPASNS